MTEALLETYIRQLMQSSPGPQVDVAWQGGEPMLRGLDFFRRSVELANKYRQPHQRVLHTIQTNGTLIDDEWAGLFQGAQLPRRLQRRRSARLARRLPRGQAERGQLRRRAARLAVPAPARRRRQHPVHDPRRQRRPSAGGLSLLPRRIEGAVHPADSDRRARHRGDDRPGEPGLGRPEAAPIGRSTRSPAVW